MNANTSSYHGYCYFVIISSHVLDSKIFVSFMFSDRKIFVDLVSFVFEKKNAIFVNVTKYNINPFINHVLQLLLVPFFPDSKSLLKCVNKFLIHARNDATENLKHYKSIKQLFSCSK